MQLKILLPRLALALVALLLPVGAVALTATPAQAVGCYGDWCSGQDPRATSCDVGARTVSETRVLVHYFVPGMTPPEEMRDVGKLELRWSPTCKTNWGRLITDRTSYIERVLVTQDGGYQQEKWTRGFWGDTGIGTFWTPMIYSPVKATIAWVKCQPKISTTLDCGRHNGTEWV